MAGCKAPGCAADRQGLADHLYYGAARSVCRVCKQGVDAKIVFRDDKVVLEKYCPAHGHQSCLVSSSVDWYLDAMSFLAPNLPPAEAHTENARGCPFDCGYCPTHRQRLFLPVVPITSACNLDCPICYTVNNNRDVYRMSREELARILDRLAESGDELDIINFTGGEPMIHPEIETFLEMCRDAGLRRLTISTNGLALVDESVVARLKELDARVIISLDTFDERTDIAMHRAPTLGSKLRAMELLGKHGVTTTVLPAIAAGLNDADLPRLLDLVLEQDNIVSLEAHTMCFTGQGGASFERASRITVPDLHRILERHTAGRICATDFVPSPLAHPQCYSICYLLMLDGGDRSFVPFARLMGRAELYDLLGESLYIEPRDRLEQVFLDVIDRLWADPNALEDSERVLATLKRLINDMFPPGGPVLSIDQRRRIAERTVKAIYIHSHMDEESFEVSRAVKCCVGVPEGDGRIIPTCSYNVLYRERDSRFAGERTPGCEAGLKDEGSRE